MAGNLHIGTLEPKRRAWEDLLSLLRNTLDAWLKCQVAWMYLEPIFASPDIQKQLPAESKSFQSVDSTWRTNMAKVQKTPKIMPLLRREKTNLLTSYEGANKLLEVIQKRLDAYLEKKRMAFPRFYFLSDDDLLQVFVSFL
jgi:dynein heavy chain